ncbi:MAG: glycosyltransferase family 2 protein, partial [Ilumatobacteraceae bacterium]
METDPQLVPSVVSVMVVHEPDDWFEDTLVALAGQDYGNFRTLFLVASDDGHDDAAITERIRAVIPSAFVRPLDHNPGFGPAANEVLRLVDGDNGFFLICHDDIAPAQNAVRMMVAELFRSNAGVVGPKLVDWHEPRRLQHVGLGLDRFGEVDPIVEPGEFDQEQHDAVRDVFVLPSACLLVRADLFRALGGFDHGISFHGDDIDFCWRAHMTGARVVIAPDAVVRHLERLPERRPDLNHRTLRSRHRMRSVAALTSGSRLLGRSVQLVLLTLFELIIGLFTGRFSEAAASLQALVGLIPRTGAILARRREIRGQRVVPEREILGLQDAGSSRLTSYLRGKETTTYVGADTTVRRWRETSFGPLLAWVVVILGVVIGSRTLIRQGVPDVGQFLPMPQSPTALWHRYGSSFDGRGLGATAALPTGVVVLSVLSVLTLFHMGLLLTLSIVGLYLLGALGAWRLSTVFPVNRARIAGMVVYVGTPLVPGALGRGDFPLLVWFAALPWLLHLLRRSAGLEAADPDAAEIDLVDGIAAVTSRQRARSIALLSLTLALAASFVPVAVVLWAAIGALVALATLLAGGSWRISLWMTGCTAASVVVAAALNLPWSTQWSWRDLVGAPLGGPTGRSVAEIATLSPTTDRFA